MNSRQLHVFVQIAETGNLRKAAARLHIAQPALSRHVRALEDELGVKLFDRHPHGVSVTAAGARLLERSRAILQEIEETRSEIMAAGDRLAGRVTVGSSTSISKLLYARLMDHFRNRYSDVILNLFEGGFYELLEGLDTRRIDLAIMADVEPRSNLVLSPLVLDSLCVFGLPDDDRLPEGGISLADMRSLPLVMVRRPSGPRMTLDKAAAAANVALDIAYEQDNPDVVKTFVRRGLGYGILPRCSLVGECADGDYRVCPIEGLYLHRVLVRRGDQTETPASRAVEQSLRDEFSLLCDEGVFSPHSG